MTIINRGAGEWIVPSTSTVGVAHLVKRVNGEFTCSCAAGYFRGDCKHQRAVKAAQPQTASTGPSAAETASLFMAPRHRA